MSSGPIFDVDDRDNLAFQNFGSTTISSDVPSGRISPNAPVQQRANAGLYDAEQRLSSSLDGATRSGGLLNLDFYARYFDVDTSTVLTRCFKTMVPREDYVAEVLSDVPDLYGPFWVPTTLVFSLFLTTSLSTSVHAYLDGESYRYDFTRLGAAFTLVYLYALGFPVVVWAALKYWAGATERSVVEVISLYGYSTTVWIIASWLNLLPVSILRLALVFGATAISLFFLIRNLYPVISNAPNVSSRLLLVVIVVVHLITSLALYWAFLASGSGALHSGNPDLGLEKPTPGGGGDMDDPAGDGTVIKLWWSDKQQQQQQQER
ncbi:hypothetical protein OIO90_005163 [Microbotryomycetes sp. JL221]|nr:hypothetical protein OIO90_005163 [Microbotryomycetes sp. JL221]